MKTIWKFSLVVTDEPQQVALPAEHFLLTARQRPGSGGWIDVWAEVDSDSPARARAFRVHGTGHPPEDGWEYVATTFDDELGFVWHVYAETP